MSDLALFHNEAQYLIADDIPFQFFPNKKQWWGAQQEFTATDKYFRKKTITWGKPLIYICNPEDDPFHTPLWNTWFEQNSIRVDIIDSLFE